MRGFKTLWRLALGRNRNRELRRNDMAGTPSSDPPAREIKEQTARLLGGEPPTRTLQ